MIYFVYQNKPLGTGDAVLKCSKHIDTKHFLMLLPDDLITKKNCSKEMISLYRKKKSSIIATKRVKILWSKRSTYRIQKRSFHLI